MLLLFGGSFDPVHRGHEAIADAARTAHPDARLLWIPAGHAPHKPGRAPAPPADRLALLQLVVRTRPGESIHLGELERSPPSYMVDTLDELRALYPGEEFRLLIGADSLDHLASWRDPERLFRAASFAILPRPGVGREALCSFREALPTELAAVFCADWLEMPLVPESSTQIRIALREGRPPPGLRPEVAAEIRRRGLYGARPSTGD